MGQPAARQSDKIIATDIHIIMTPTPTGPVPTPIPHPFTGVINGNLSPNVKIMGLPAATVGSTAQNVPTHVPQWQTRRKKRRYGYHVQRPRRSAGW